jgi:hypothetical protein
MPAPPPAHVSSPWSSGFAPILALAAVLLLAAMARAMAAPEVTLIELTTVEPAILAAYTPATLVLRGSGFVAGAQVFIESGTADRFLAYAPLALSAEGCEVDLRLGFGPVPSERRIYIRNPDGTQSLPLRLRVGLSPATPPTSLPELPATERATTPDDSAVPTGEAPTIRELRPSALPSGRPVEMEILGSGFANGAKVEVTVNLLAGSSRMPEYGARLFAADWLDEGELAVAFDRGFHPSPGVRHLVVVNPDGRRSGVALLRILAAKEEP